MRLFDSHCHMDDESYDRDRDAVIERALQNNVAGMMLASVDLESAGAVVRIAEAHDGLYASVGVHPHDAKKCTENALDALVSLAAHGKVRAWGETGLDFNRMFSPMEVQEKWLIRQIETADTLDLPMIFHERDSEGRFLKILESVRKSDAGGVIHCFSGSPRELDAYLDLGFHIGITGILTIEGRGADLRKMVRKVPAERLLIETDAPYLTPTPERNKHRRNEPAFVRSVLVKLAEVRKEDPEALAEILWQNTCRLYRIKG